MIPFYIDMYFYMPVIISGIWILKRFRDGQDKRWSVAHKVTVKYFFLFTIDFH